MSNHEKEGTPPSRKGKTRSQDRSGVNNSKWHIHVQVASKECKTFIAYHNIPH
jgi:hypothetical protein